MKSDIAPATSLREIAVVIPAWRPDERLIPLAQALAGVGFAAIIVVNDGSGGDYAEIFGRAREVSSVTVLEHTTNYGQGRAVRTGLRYALETVPNLRGVVTADADGQHAVEDVARVAGTLIASGPRPVLGTRRFGAGVPLRSRFGNIVTQYVFWVLSAVMVTDTQSGLRGVPRELIPDVLRVNSDRFEFAVSLLALFCRIGRRPIELPIATIYLDGNRSSHFKPVRDSIRIYSHLAWSYASILVPVLADFAGFAAAYAQSGNLAAAVLTGRLSAIATLTLLYFVAGKNNRDSIASVALRALAFAVTGAIAFGAMRLLTVRLGWSVWAAKFLVEGLLYFALGTIRIFARRRGESK
jgi:glycosyltransferase involved in cell wall biosynthesis